MRRVTPLALLTLTLSACASLEGPPADLHQLATPDPQLPAVRTVVQPAPGPTPGVGRWRAWLPTQRTPTGDVVEGHWLELSTEPPVVVETLEPVKPLPRAPKVAFGKAQPPPSSHPPVAPSLAVAPPPPVVSPQPVLPEGLGSVPRGVRSLSPRTPLGGP